MNKVSISTTKIILLLIYLMEFSNFYIGFFPQFQYIKYISICIVGIYLFQRVSIFTKKEHIKTNGMLLLFAVVMLYPSVLYMNNYERNPLLATIVFWMIQLETFLVMEVMCENGKMKTVIQFYYKLTLVWTIITDMLTILFPLIFTTRAGNYLVGTKFTVSYMHLLLIALAMTQNRISKKGKVVSNSALILMLIWSAFIIVSVQCNTGLIGLILLFIMLTVPKQIQNKLCSPLLFIGVVAISTAFSIGYEAILANPAIQHFISVYFKRELTLTGRTYIYAMMPKILKGHYVIGYGYGTTYEVCRRFTGFANTQNAVLEWIVQLGIVGTIVLIVLFMLAFIKLKKCNEADVNELMPLVAYIYSMVLLGTVEITMDNLFFGIVAVVYGLACNTIRKEKKHL